MEAIFLLIPLSLALLGVAVWLFFRMDDSGQFKDLETHGRQLLLDDDSTVVQADQKGVAASQQTPSQAAMTSSQTEENTSNNR
ncbi:MAG: cbb3-type cytochrome oxidase assembly protein CcoS [Betaproteobacteria bacterium]